MSDSSQASQPPHQPVLYQQSIEFLQPKSPGKYLDGTLGAGGHAAGILETSSPSGRLIGLDKDVQALSIAKSRLEPYGSRVSIIKGSFGDLRMYLKNANWDCVNGIILDLGTSSLQLNTAKRGFSFLKNAPLDMRFDQDNSLTAATILNTWSEEELARVIWEFGEETRSRQIAAAIVHLRPIRTTQELATLVNKLYGGKRSKIHPATRTFQAIRIAVNQELETLRKGLEEAVEALCPGGRLVVISFHSLEDRIVKQYFRRESRDCLCPPEQITCTCGHKAILKIITKRAIKPTQEEIESNPRSRSAKLRAVEKF